MGDLRAAVIVRAGTTKIVNCRICALNQNIVKLGIVVLPNAKLIIENTVFDNLGTGLVIYSNGEVCMSNCSFKNCAEGIQVCRFRLDCHYYALHDYETTYNYNVLFSAT